MICRISIITLAATMMVVACGQETVLNIFLEEKETPSFSFSGSAFAGNFEILELPGTELKKINPYSFSGKTIWKISSRERIKADKWPAVTYGDVPSGFLQTIPERDSPPKLAADKLYAATIVGDKQSKTVLFFEIRNGRPVEVSDKVGRP